MIFVILARLKFSSRYISFQILVLDVGQHPIPDLIIALIPIVTVLDQNF